MLCIFNSQFASIAQHIAVPVEVIAICLLWRDYKLYVADYNATVGGTWLEMGEMAIQPDRSNRFILGLRLAVIALFLELYQLISLWVGN